MKRILLADDQSIIRRGLTQILKDEFPAVEITEVGDGVSAIKEVTFHDFDLVISDLDMPGMSGLDVLRQIQLTKPKLPVLILSVYAEDLYAVRVLRAGGAGYMNKNVTPYELINAIRRIALGKKYITPEIAEKLLINRDTSKRPHELLTNRELEILKLLAEGKTVTQIAQLLSSALTTVSTHRRRILGKLGLATNSELTRYAIAHHIISDIPLYNSTNSPASS
jgi:two-component system invasion response regulator UvrY